MVKVSELRKEVKNYRGENEGKGFKVGFIWVDGDEVREEVIYRSSRKLAVGWLEDKIKASSKAEQSFWAFLGNEVYYTEANDDDFDWEGK